MESDGTPLAIWLMLFGVGLPIALAIVGKTLGSMVRAHIAWANLVRDLQDESQKAQDLTPRKPDGDRLYYMPCLEVYFGGEVRWGYYPIERNKPTPWLKWMLRSLRFSWQYPAVSPVVHDEQSLLASEQRLLIKTGGIGAILIHPAGYPKWVPKDPAGESG